MELGQDHKLWRIEKREAPEDFPTFMFTTWSLLVHRRPSYLDFGFCAWARQVPLVGAIERYEPCAYSGDLQAPKDNFKGSTCIYD
jgi:hypothetical protein